MSTFRLNILKLSFRTKRHYNVRTNVLWFWTTLYSMGVGPQSPQLASSFANQRERVTVSM